MAHTPTDSWEAIESIPVLSASNLYVFRVNLPVTPELERQCYDVLSPEEAARVARFKNTLACQHSLIGRGVLRYLLGSFLDILPQNITLHLGPNGKPQVDGLSFNVAHSGDVILLAFARTGLLGIDVERHNPTTPVFEIAERYFAPAEIETIRRSATDSEQRAAFFTLWSRKEAIIKADGRGLSVPLNSFSAEDLTTVPDIHGINRTFRVHTIPTSAEYAAALATDQLDATPTLLLYPAQ